MKKRQQGCKGHGQSSIVRGTRISFELDARLDRLNSELELSKSQLIAECALLGIGQLERLYGVVCDDLQTLDCSVVADSDERPYDPSYSEGIDNNDEDRQ